MRKRIAILWGIGVFFLFTPPVLAKTFNEKKIPEYTIKTSGKNPTISISGGVYKVTDEKNLLYFAINPTNNFFHGSHYISKTSNLSDKQWEKISKIIYYGYGYQNQNTDAFYLATQFLIYKTFTQYEISFIDADRNKISLLEKEIEQIQKNIETSHFLFEEFTTTEKSFLITDSYILNNFTIKGDNLKIVESDKNIKITLLDDLEEYSLQFIPKTNCTNIEIWGSSNSKNEQYVHMDSICENTYSRTVHLKKQDVKVEKDKTNIIENNSNNEEIENENNKNDINMERTENFTEELVRVPSTKKSSFFNFFLLLLLGNFYFIIKK